MRRASQGSSAPAVPTQRMRGDGGTRSSTWSNTSDAWPPTATIWRSGIRIRLPGAMRYVYDFDEPSGGGRELLGGKGVGLAEMTQLGVPVPAGFTITTDACRAYMAAGGEELPEGLPAEIDRHIDALEGRAGKRFGDPQYPVLVSGRSGA